MCGTDLPYGPLQTLVKQASQTAKYSPLPRHFHTPYARSGTDSECYAMAGTDVGYAATRLQMDGLGLTEFPKGVLTVSAPICLRACYAMSGTDIAYGASVSCSALAMRCPRIAYQMTAITELSVQSNALTGRPTLRPYAMPYKVRAKSGTDLAYASTRASAGNWSFNGAEAPFSRMAPLWSYARAMRCPVLRQRIVVSAYSCCDVRCNIRTCYAASGTDMGCLATYPLCDVRY
eukprot:919417-Rhodomonas_salina.6